MNPLEMFQLCGIFRPKFHEQRNAKDEITTPQCQYEDHVLRRRKRSLHLLVATDPAYTRSGVGEIGGTLGLNTAVAVPAPI